MTIILAEEEASRALALAGVFAYVLVAGEIVIAQSGATLVADEIASAYEKNTGVAIHPDRNIL